MTRLSVVVPVYNAEGTLRRCLDSLLRQGMREVYEIICVDDGSTDGTIGILEEYQRWYPGIVFVTRQAHEGVAKARNRGLALARGETVAFCDADDYLIDGAYGMLLERFWDDETEVLTFGSVTVDRYAARRLEELDRLDGEVIYEGSGWQYYQERGYRMFCWHHLFRRNFLQRHQIGFEDRRIGEDVQFCLDVHRHDPKIKEVSCCLYRYVVNDRQTTARRDADVMSRMVKDYLALFESFQASGLPQYIERELVPMTSRMLSARLSKEEYLSVRHTIDRMGVLPLQHGGYVRVINLVFRSFFNYKLFSFFYRWLFVPCVLPWLHRNANI